MSAKLPEFFRRFVRHLSLEPDRRSSLDEAKQLLKLCKGLVNFSCYAYVEHPTFLPILAEMRLERLSANLDRLFAGSIDFQHPLFEAVTHLDMCGMMLFRTQPLATIHTLPALTHLCLPNLTLRPVISAVLAQSPRLQLLLVIWCSFDVDFYYLARTPHVYDVRFVIGVYENLWANWEAGARGLPDLWSEGIVFVARKRASKIEATCYWLDDLD